LTIEFQKQDEEDKQKQLLNSKSLLPPLLLGEENQVALAALQNQLEVPKNSAQLKTSLQSLKKLLQLKHNLRNSRKLTRRQKPNS